MNHLVVIIAHDVVVFFLFFHYRGRDRDAGGGGWRAREKQKIGLQVSEQCCISLILM